MISTGLVVASLVAFAFAVTVASLLWRLRQPCVSEITPEWLTSFSIERYRPMERLLAKEDFLFLSHQPGFDSSMEKKLRRERMQIFREYLCRMIKDFNRVHALIRWQIAQSSTDQSELASELVKLKFRFCRALILTECCFFLCRFTTVGLRVRALVSCLEQTSECMIRLSCSHG